MKLIPLSKQGKHKGKYFAMVDDGDYEWINRMRWFVVKNRNNFYAETQVCENGKKRNIKMHRLILGLNSGVGDHKDHNGLNNQRYNIRGCTAAENGRNKRSAKNSTSKYIGVHLKKQIKSGVEYLYWVAQVRLNGKIAFAKTYKTENEAALAYNNNALRLFGDYANINIINTK